MKEFFGKDNTSNKDRHTKLLTKILAKWLAYIPDWREGSPTLVGRQGSLCDISGRGGKEEKSSEKDLQLTPCS